MTKTCPWCQHPQHEGGCRQTIECTMPPTSAPCPCQTLRELHRIPGLAAEVFLTWGHPNPSDRPERRGRGDVAQAPTDLAVLDALRPWSDSGHSLVARLVEAVRAVFDDTWVDGVRDTPAFADPPTFASEADWLLVTVGLWAGDAWRYEMVRDAARDVHGELARLAREHPPVRLTCPMMVNTTRWVDGHIETVAQPCGHTARPYDADGKRCTLAEAAWFECDHGHVVDHWAAIERMGRLSQGIVPEVADVLGVKPARIRQWIRRGLLSPVGQRDGRKLYTIADAAQVRDTLASTA